MDALLQIMKTADLLKVCFSFFIARAFLGLDVMRIRNMAIMK
jgi:hypothetical protein